MILSSKGFCDIPEIKDNYVGYKADHDGSDNEMVSSVTVGYIRNGLERLKIRKPVRSALSWYGSICDNRE
jgi:hypothetical protein